MNLVNVGDHVRPWSWSAARGVVVSVNSEFVYVLLTHDVGAVAFLPEQLDVVSAVERLAELA